MPRAAFGFITPNRSLDAAGSDFSDGFWVSHDVFPPKKLRVCERFRSPADGGNVQTLAREEQRGRSRRRAGPARARASARRLQARGTVLARALRRNQPEPASASGTWAQPQHPFSGRRRQARWGTGNRDGAPGTGPPGSGERKAGAEVIAEWMFAEVTGVEPARFISAGSLAKVKHTHQRGASPPFSLPSAFLLWRFFQVICFWNPEGRAMKTAFLLLLLLSTGGCAAKQWPPISITLPKDSRGPKNAGFHDVGKPGAFGTALGSVPGMSGEEEADRPLWHSCY